MMPSTDKDLFRLLPEKIEELSGSSRTGSLLVSSPNFPLGYAVRGEIYTYSIRNTDPGGFIRLFFTDWDLSPHSRITVSFFVYRWVPLITIWKSEFPVNSNGNVMEIAHDFLHTKLKIRPTKGFSIGRFYYFFEFSGRHLYPPSR